MTRDERIVHFKKGLSDLFLPYYDALWECAPPVFQPYFGRRDSTAQDLLYAKGRNDEGRIVNRKEVVTNARGGESPHQYGCATDATIFLQEGRPIWLEYDDERWIPFIEAVQKVGLASGSAFNDPGHAELPIKCSWRDVHKVYLDEGEAVALRFIGENLLA